jgi:hypothetical protein
MTTFTRTVLLTAAALMVSTAVLGGSASSDPTTQLKETKQRLATRASGEKGLPKALLNQEQLRLGDLIDDLEAGKRVDPQEIDRALEHANQLGR